MQFVLITLILDNYIYISRILFYVIHLLKNPQYFSLAQKPKALKNFLRKNHKVPGFFFFSHQERVYRSRLPTASMSDITLEALP